MTVQEDVKSASNRCNGIYNPIPKFWHLYAFNTENIKEYSEYFDLENKSLLTIGSSGEQVINARIKGANDITLYDVSPFAKYYTWLKIAAILSLDYSDYQYFFMANVHKSRGYGNNVYRFNKRLFDKVAPVLKSLDYESYYFWSELYASIKSKSNLSTLFLDEERRADVIRGYSLYLDSEEDYLKAKKAVRDISFKYIHGDLFKDPVNDEYDNIWLSNLCTYYKVHEILDLIKKLDKNLKIDGKMLFAYLYEVDYSFDNEEEDDLMYNMVFVKEFFKKYLTEHHNVRTAREIFWKDKRDKEDLILVYKKNKN